MSYIQKIRKNKKVIILKKIILKIGVHRIIAGIFMRRQYKQMIKDLDIGSPKSILDIGGGSGTFANMLRKKVPNVPYTILETDLEEIKKGSKKNPEIKFIKGDVERLRLKSKSYDLVICKDVLHHCKNPKKAVREIKRVGKKHLIIEGRRGDKWLDYWLEGHDHFTLEKFKKIVGSNNIKYLNMMWPNVIIMSFLIFLPKIPKSPRAFMYIQN